jgi:hypothetical protein
MSADAHAGGHAHDGHDHGHDHAHGEGWTPNQKSVALAAFVIAALLATGYYLVKRGEKLHGGAHAAAEKVVGAEPHGTKADVAIRRPTKAYPEGGIGGRQRFADQHERRMKRRGRDLKVQATGNEGTIFELAYSPNAADQHLEELKRAIPFQRHLRGLGFKKMVLKVGTREVWSKDL